MLRVTYSTLALPKMSFAYILEIVSLLKINIPLKRPQGHLLPPALCRELQGKKTAQLHKNTHVALKRREGVFLNSAATLQTLQAVTQGGKKRIFN